MSQQPNVLIIQTDQQSLWTLGCYGGREVETPYIDSIAADGVKFNEFYTVSAVCTPSRGCFVSGQYPHTNGAYRNDAPIRQETETFARIFKKAGYKTAYVGKWHLDGGAYPGWMENDRAVGFEDCEFMFNCGHYKQIIDKDNGKPEVVANVPGDEKTYTTDYLVTKTIGKIKKYKDSPFLVMVSIPDPHQPFNVRAPYDTMYNEEDMVIPNSFYQEELPDWADHDEWGRKRYFPMDMEEREQKLRRIKAQYCGEVKCIDDNVGRIIKYLKDQNLYDNTIIVFTTDHGEYMGEHGLLEKNNLFDTAYHIPMIMSWPERVPAGTEVDNYVSIVDFQQTLLSLVGLEASGLEQGRDALPLIYQKEIEWRDEIFIHPSDVPRAGIITPEYQLAYVGRGWKREEGHEFKDHILFDRRNDRHQMNNLYDSEGHRAIVQGLRQKMMEHFDGLDFDKDCLPPALYR